MNSDVQSLYREAFRLQALKNAAKDQLLDARLAHEDASRACKEAWKKHDSAFAASKQQTRILEDYRKFRVVRAATGIKAEDWNSMSARNRLLLFKKYK